ncbi:MAG: protein kinase domain-containing protein [Actinomycetota bacterium]
MGPTDPMVGPTFASTLEKALEGSPTPARIIADPNGIWLHVDLQDVDVPSRGWKLHVSATPWSARDVLEACLPILLAEKTPFKIAADVGRLIEINEGVGGIAQAGKFMTVYPVDTETSVRIARALDDATAGLRGPRVLSDRPLSPSSLVHYRYADYVPDPGPRTPVPEDPFVASGLVDEKTVKLINGRYLVTADLHRSVRGAIHLAVDAEQGDNCVLKRAWRSALVTPDGKDAGERLREEAEVLRELDDDAHFPSVRDVFEEDLDVFVAMDHIEGPPFVVRIRARHDEGSSPTPSEIVAWGRELLAALKVMHERGYVHRDLNPINVIVSEQLMLIDLELARAIGAREASYGAGTIGYMSPNQQRGGPAEVGDDLFGVSALMFLAATASDPDPDAKVTGPDVLARMKMPDAALAELIARGLAAGANDWRSAAEMADALGEVEGT